jgi:hypothetical protein
MIDDYVSSLLRIILEAPELSIYNREISNSRSSGKATTARRT